MLMRISSWNFVRGQGAKFHFEILIINVISSILYLHENILKSSETLVKQPRVPIDVIYMCLTFDWVAVQKLT